MNNNKITVGLDLGTDKCCITYQDNIGRPFIITDEKNHKISSIIGILNNGLLIGNEISKDLIYDIPIITNLKRLIGYNSNNTEAQNIAKYQNWKLEDDPNGDLLICITNANNVYNKYKLSDLMCSLLQKIKQIIISNIGDNFNMVITVPANFNEGQKNLILNYCNSVGIDCKRLIYEPCSAALAYINYFDPDHNLNKSKDHNIANTTNLANLANTTNLANLANTTNSESESESDYDNMILKRIAVFDFGAGTLDLAIVSCNCLIDNDQYEWMAKIESNIGDNNLGGLDIDIELGKYIEEKFPKFKKLLDSKNESMRFIIEKIKVKLSKLYTDHKMLTISLVERYYDQNIVINIQEYFDLLNKCFKKRILDLIDRLHTKNIGKSDIDNILLIGGSCYNPWIINLIESYYSKEVKTYRLLMTDHLENYNLDIRDIGVSLGATCVDRKLNKYGNSLILTESLPLSIGIDTTNNLMCKLLPKNTLIPCSAKKYFTTSEDNQTLIEIKLYQGERDDIRDNFFLGSFIMDNLDPEPQGKIVIIVNISVSTDGLITVEGKVKNTEQFNKKLIINRYNSNINCNLIESNIRQFELNDSVFNSIMRKYYELVTMMSRLQYNLLDNISCVFENDVINSVFEMFWDDLIVVYKLMSQSEKIKTNIQQLTKCIEYIESKMSYVSNTNSIDYTDDNVIASRLDKLNKFIEKNLQHLVSTHQIKTSGVDESIVTNYDSIENEHKLGQINSITNSTEILSSTEKELLYQIENSINLSKDNLSKDNLSKDNLSKDNLSKDNLSKDNLSKHTYIKSNLTYIKEIKDLSMMVVNEIDSFEMADENKLLLLEIFDKYDTYIELIIKNNSQFDGGYQLETIQNLCMIIANIEDLSIIENIQNKLNDIDIENHNSISDFEKLLNELEKYNQI
jgi:molecular chaperone DnaK (HSP70)